MGLLRPGPGLVGMAARTAVVAGTATTVSGRVSRRQQNKYDQQYEQQASAEPQAPPAAPAPPPAAAPADDDLVGQLQKLATLHQQGILSDAEFEGAKQRLISG